MDRESAMRILIAYGDSGEGDMKSPQGTGVDTIDFAPTPDFRGNAASLRVNRRAFIVDVPGGATNERAILRAAKLGPLHGEHRSRANGG